jgi:polygalacturonase
MRRNIFLFGLATLSALASSLELTAVRLAKAGASTAAPARKYETGADTDRLQAALDEVSRAGGGRVILRRGVYRIDRPLRISDRNVRLTSNDGAVLRAASRVALEIDGPGHVIQGLTIQLFPSA